MSPKETKQYEAEEHLNHIQRKHYIGKFKVLINQTKIHPEQRALDPDWVDKLVEEIGNSETLNQASHPIAAVLEDDSMVNSLLVELEQGINKDKTPGLPKGVTVLVFAGQHHLAMLPQLGLSDPAELWWHADIYERKLELKNPAEFLTLMHASNVPDVKQPNRDVDLFRAVLKLKNLLESKVAAGLVMEMTAQVDQLTRGMREVPQQVFSFQGRHCRIDHIETLVKKKKKHPWDVLPGGVASALDWVRVRPRSFVSTLNPKTSDPWSLPDVVLLPNCLGSKIIEDELKLTHQVVLHLLKMTCNDLHFDRYTRSNPETLEDPTDHPAGMIAHVLNERHAKSQKLAGYENRILQAAWKGRTKLIEELTKYWVPRTEEATAKDYRHLLEGSKSWWSLLRLFKIHRFENNLGLEVPKVFQESTAGKAESRGIEGVTSATSNPSSKTLKCHSEDTAPEAGTNKKRTRLSPKAKTSATKEQSSNVKDLQSEESEAEGEVGQEGEYIGVRTGSNRRLNKALENVKGVAASMTCTESCAVTTLLEGIFKAKQSGELEEFSTALAEKTKQMFNKMEKQDKSISEIGEEGGELELEGTKGNSE